MSNIRFRIPSPLLAVAAIACLTVAASGCGLKGALTMPSQSDEVVIRPAPGTTTEGTAPANPAGESTTTQPERLPPPPLPGGNAGTSRSG